MGNLVSAVGGVVTVLVAIAALVYTNQNSADQRRADRAQRQLVEQGQITDRFSRAVDQLGQRGPEKIDVRIGAIFSLQRIMRDSPAGQDQPAVAELLTTFVRTHSARRPGTPMPADLQLALTVLGGRDPMHDGNYVVDLTEADLDGASLADARLDGVILRGTRLSQAEAYGAQLKGAYLGRADLTTADLAGATLSEATFAGTRLRGADLTYATLTGASLECVDLTGAKLSRAHLAKITAGWLNPVEPGESISMAVPFGSNFSRDCPVPGPPVTFEKADLTGADLTGSELGKSDLTGATLNCANLRGANLSLVNGLTEKQLGESILDDQTKLPEGIARPPAGSDRECPVATPESTGAMPCGDAPC